MVIAVITSSKSENLAFNNGLARTSKNHCPGQTRHPPSCSPARTANSCARKNSPWTRC